MKRELFQGGAFHVYDVNEGQTEESFLKGVGVGTAFVVKGTTGACVKQSVGRFNRAAQRAGLTLQWDEPYDETRRERVVITGLAPNQLTQLVHTVRQEGLVVARDCRPWVSTPELEVDPVTGQADINRLAAAG